MTELTHRPAMTSTAHAVVPPAIMSPYKLTLWPTPGAGPPGLREKVQQSLYLLTAVHGPTSRSRPA
jgi:hypothetical protein